MSKRDQAIQVIVTLAGPQDVDVTDHQAGTDSAMIGVRVGGTLMHFTDAATVNGFSMAWRTAATRIRELPGHSDLAKVDPIGGVVMPAVYMKAGGSPHALAKLRPGPPGQPSRMWVTLGRIRFDVRDQEALVSTAVAFRQAVRMAPAVFLPTADQRIVERAAAAASRLLATPPNRRALRPGVPSRTSSAPLHTTAEPVPRSPRLRSSTEGMVR